MGREVKILGRMVKFEGKLGILTQILANFPPRRFLPSEDEVKILC